MKFIYLILFFCAKIYATEDNYRPTKMNDYIYRELSSNSVAKKLSSDSFEDCHVKFKDFKFQHYEDELYFKEKSPIHTWICLNAGEVYEQGYDTSIVDHRSQTVSIADNKIIYDYSMKKWLSVHDDKYPKAMKPNHLQLILINSYNAKGYIVTNERSYLNNGKLGKGIYFCMVHKYDALCGYGDAIKHENGKEVDNTKNLIQLIESIIFIEKNT